jgi:hypothetical protein
VHAKAYEEVDEGPNLVEIQVTETFSGDVEGKGVVHLLQAATPAPRPGSANAATGIGIGIALPVI